ncbi:MAG: hypothetical protein RL030_1195, partial [Pseudomonadota bacterium]
MNTTRVLGLIATFAMAGSAFAAESTPLLDATYAGDAPKVAALLKEGADPDAANAFGATPMGEAARIGNATLLELLLDAGADPESANVDGQTALMAVARTGNIEAARALLRHGARVDAREKWGGQTALIWAAAQNQPEMVRFLVSRGADVNAHGTVREWQRRVTAEGRPKDMNRGGLTALLYAAREGHLDTLQVLVDLKADLDLADPDGTTPLVLALMNGHWDAARLLVNAGADVNLWDFWGQSPLYMAVDLNTLPTGARVELPGMDKATGMELIQLLLARGAHPNVQLKLRIPLRNAVQDRQSDLMLTTGTTPLLRAAKAADLQAMRALLDAGADANLANDIGYTPLLAAAGAGRGNSPTRNGQKTEDMAIEAVKMLLAAGADVNARGADSDTALIGAAYRGWTRLAEVLAGAGADLDAGDKDGMTAIDYAMG